MTTSVITTKGQLVIPAKLRKRLNLKRGTKVSIEERGKEIVIRPITPEYFDRFGGILPKKDNLLKELLTERAREREKEDKR